MSTAYQKGYTFELKCKAYLESIGYTVFRVGGSHSPADLIAICGSEDNYLFPEVWLIQCQRSKYFSKDKKNELIQLAVKSHCKQTLVWAEDARKRGNLGVKFSDNAIINSAPRNGRAVELGG